MSPDEFGNANGRDPGPITVEEALRRAAGHGRAAAGEAVAALRALVDAASLAARGDLADESSPLGLFGRALDDLSANLAGPRDASGAALVRAIADALDHEVARWEERAKEDPDARAILRAYLGVREVLWDLGVRDTARRSGPARPHGARRPGPKSVRRTRVQRVEIDD